MFLFFGKCFHTMSSTDQSGQHPCALQPEALCQWSNMDQRSVRHQPQGGSQEQRNEDARLRHGSSGLCETTAGCSCTRILTLISRFSNRAAEKQQRRLNHHKQKGSSWRNQGFEPDQEGGWITCTLSTWQWSIIDRSVTCGYRIISCVKSQLSDSRSPCRGESVCEVGQNWARWWHNLFKQSRFPAGNSVSPLAEWRHASARGSRCQPLAFYSSSATLLCLSGRAELHFNQFILTTHSLRHNKYVHSLL